jgi:hypothetical protein
MAKILILLLICIALVEGCATMSPKAVGIREADERMVAGCKFLGTAEGNSLWGGVVQAAALENAKAEALNKAAAMGTTHLIWTKIDAGWWGQRVWGRAYECK